MEGRSRRETAVLAGMISAYNTLRVIPPQKEVFVWQSLYRM
jgi:hypothetical protein